MSGISVHFPRTTRDSKSLKASVPVLTLPRQGRWDRVNGIEFRNAKEECRGLRVCSLLHTACLRGTVEFEPQFVAVVERIRFGPEGLFV